MAPDALQASVCDEQLGSIGGEIALSGNILIRLMKTCKCKNTSMLTGGHTTLDVLQEYHLNDTLGPVRY